MPVQFWTAARRRLSNLSVQSERQCERRNLNTHRERGERPRRHASVCAELVPVQSVRRVSGPPSRARPRRGRGRGRPADGHHRWPQKFHLRAALPDPSGPPFSHAVAPRPVATRTVATRSRPSWSVRLKPPPPELPSGVRAFHGQKRSSPLLAPSLPSIECRTTAPVHQVPVPIEPPMKPQIEPLWSPARKRP